MNSKKTFTTDRLEKIMASALNKRSLNQTQSLNFAKYPAYKLNAQKASAPFKKYLPYSLNYKNFEKAVLFIALTLLFSAVGTPEALAAAGIRPANPMAALTSLQERMQRTEAGAGAEVCTDCASRSPQSSLSNYLSQLPVVRDGFARVHNATYYDDGQDKASIILLRARRTRGETLTTEELAILEAANRTGFVRFPDCANERGHTLTGNAFLVNNNGRDSIMTNAHIVADGHNGQFRNGCTLAQLQRVQYYPNFSYIDAPMGQAIDANSEEMMTVSGTLDESVGGLNQGFIPFSKDFIVINLDEQISNQRTLDGTVRGAFQFSEPTRGVQTAYMVGVDPLFYQNSGLRHVSYQTCELVQAEDQTYHSCDTVPGVSGSVIAVMQDGELRFHSMHTDSNPFIDNPEVSRPLPDGHTERNVGTPSSVIQDALRAARNIRVTES